MTNPLLDKQPKLSMLYYLHINFPKVFIRADVLIDYLFILYRIRFVNQLDHLQTNAFEKSLTIKSEQDIQCFKQVYIRPRKKIYLFPLPRLTLRHRRRKKSLYVAFSGDTNIKHLKVLIQQQVIVS